MKLNFDHFNHAYRFICISAAIGFAIWAIYLYQLDEDLTQIDVKQFNAELEGIYPSISLFFYSPITKPEKLEKYGDGITPIMYKQFLQGEIWNKTFMSIDYNDVTLDIMDYFQQLSVEYVDIGRVSYTKDAMNEKPDGKFLILMEMFPLERHLPWKFLSSPIEKLGHLP